MLELFHDHQLKRLQERSMTFEDFLRDVNLQRLIQARYLIKITLIQVRGRSRGQRLKIPSFYQRLMNETGFNINSMAFA